MLKVCLWYRLLFIALFALFPVSALALPSLSISSPGADGVFILRGNGMAGVSGMDISIGYDAATLSNPRIVLGRWVGGTFSASNPANPIRIAFVGDSPLSGGGVIATISFDRTGNSPGAITSLNASVTPSDKNLAMAPPVILNPPLVKVAANEEPNSDVLAVSTTGSAKGGAAVVGGTVELPGQEGRVVDKKPPAAGKTAQAETEPPLEREEELPVPHEEETPAVQEPQPALPQPKPVQSVLERFRTFQGERSPANLVALFNDTGAENTFRQIPPIAIADGKSSVTLVINVPTGDKAPNFAFDGCKYVALRRTAEGGWEIEARPTKGVVRASVTVLYDSLAQEIPLTVTPKAYLAKVKGRPTTRVDFESFLKQRGTATAPKFDLNKDGKRDYIDDYIYTANYLLQK